MVKISARQADAAIAKADQDYLGALIFGKDEGLVRERADRLAARILTDPDDPFALARPSAEEIAAHPGCLADELASFSLSGGRRLVHVDGASDGLTRAAGLALEIEAQPGANFLLVSAGDLGPASKLRKLFEGAANAVAIPCYADEGAALSAFIASALGEFGLKAEPAALDYLSGALEGNRAISRSEIGKLALYMLGREDQLVDLETAIRLVGDAAELHLGKIAEAVSGGEMKALDRRLDKAATGGESPIAILRAVARRFQQMDVVAAEREAGRDASRAIERLQPRLFYKDKDAFRLHLSYWNGADIRRALERLVEAELECKGGTADQEVLVARACLGIASAAARRKGQAGPYGRG